MHKEQANYQCLHHSALVGAFKSFSYNPEYRFFVLENFENFEKSENFKYSVKSWQSSKLN